MMRKIAFFDRDGVINYDTGYTHQYRPGIVIDSIYKIMKYFVNKNFEVFIVTNQSGIARGLYSTDDFHLFMNFLLRDLLNEGIEVSGYDFCQHLPIDNCLCRKPRPGMLLKELKRKPVELEECYMIGDSWTDLLAGRNAGIKKNILISKNFNSQYFTTKYEKVFADHSTLIKELYKE